MHVNKSMLALLLTLAIAIGGFGTYFVIDLTASDQANPLTEQSAQSMTEEEYKEMLEDLSDSIPLPKVTQAFSAIQENYLNEVSDQQLIEGAVRGMLATLDDPYSEYMDQETMEQFNEQIESSFEGIGAEVSMVDGKVTIIAPIKDSPAEKAGLRPNDQVVSVDDESLDGLDLFEAVSKIRGEKGSEVSLEIERPGVSDPITYTLVRDTIPLETVYSEMVELTDQQAGVIQLTSFSEHTAEDFQEQLADLEAQGIDGLVIDVRGNPGGLLPVIEDILKLFVSSDQPYMQIADGKDNVERFFSNLDEPKDYPISVLIDEGSASASEILAISLKETIDAEIIGMNSFGKGTVQSTIPMGDGSSLKLTILKWLSPEGNSVDEVGVAPTREVAQPDYYYTAPIQLDQTLSYDDSDDNIKFAQIMLDGLGYDVDREDGYFSEATEDAISQYQTDRDLSVTGELNEETAELLAYDIIERIRNNEDDLQMEAALEALFE
ncbi:S41 family peptidase [Amphibacillus cookii]|uniref:S41 family peptidase n=1 Tax=Amphibacillus cookii TaxID=767787 RepID=UPI001957FEC7|nr:carboxyl-terminal processing protease [Amphibacillus cookii]